MTAGADTLDLIYVGALFGSTALLVIFWLLLPQLLKEHAAKSDRLAVARSRPSRGLNGARDATLRQPQRGGASFRDRQHHGQRWDDRSGLNR